jgi:hypothetical protein
VTGLLGIIAPLEVDLNLILQIVMFIILGVGFYYKTAKNYRMHVSLMGMAVIFHVISFVTVMEPRLRAHSVNISISLQL